MKKVVSIIFLLIVAAVCVYVYQPTVKFGFSGIAVLLIFLSALWIFFQAPVRLSDLDQSKRQKKSNANKGDISPTRSGRSAWIAGSIIALLLIYLIFVQSITTWALFHTGQYRNLIGEVKSESNLSNHMLPISIDRIRVVDQPLAELLGDKVLGTQTALGSQAHIGTFHIQKVGKDLFWVAPLLHSGFFKWNQNKLGTNGYVMVNACNERDVRLVQEIGGKKIYIRYQPEAFFADNLYRYLYFKGYWNTGLTDYTFEIDDNGTPYWVVTKYEKTIGFDGDNATGVVILNAQTGEVKVYDTEHTPAWVDRIQPGHFVEKQLNDWGEYVKGYWNFSNEDKLAITEPVAMVYGEDNKAYWYTGLTSVGADESTVGFVLVDTRSKQAIWYKQSGATEHAAQNSAQGKVQEKGYYASQPIPYNINNIPTYVMTLKDQGGLVKMYAMVAIEDYTIVGVGNTLRETLIAYKNAYNQSNNKIGTKSRTERSSLKSVVGRINGDVKNGNTFYYLTLNNFPKTFIGSSQVSNDLPLTKAGDSVEVTFDNDNQDVIDISSLVNKSLGQK